MSGIASGSALASIGRNFISSPPFYRTEWFWVAGIVAGLCGLCFLYVFRVGQVARRSQAQMESRLDEHDSVARDVSHTLLQNILSLIFQVDAVMKQMSREEPARQALEKALDHADQVVAESSDQVRRLLGTPNPLGNLPAAFQQVARETSLRGPASVKIVTKGRVQELHPVVLQESFSIGREALMNALLHSGGLHVGVEIAYHPRQFRLRISDDGRGIDPKVLRQYGRPDHQGLLGMQKSAARIGGHLQMRSHPEAGTEVELIVPRASAYRSFHAYPGQF